VDTLGGYVQDLLGRPPQPGETVDVPGFRLTAIEIRDGRVRRLRGEPVEPAARTTWRKLRRPCPESGSTYNPAGRQARRRCSWRCRPPTLSGIQLQTAIVAEVTTCVEREVDWVGGVGRELRSYRIRDIGRRHQVAIQAGRSIRVVSGLLDRPGGSRSPSRL